MLGDLATKWSGPGTEFTVLAYCHRDSMWCSNEPTVLTEATVLRDPTMPCRLLTTD